MISTNIIKDIQTFLVDYPKGIVVLRWATATWKSSMAIEIARQLPCELISCDSRQFFHGMNIGTDKVSQAIRDEIPHHMIDTINPNEFYTAGQWKKDVEKLIPMIQAGGKIPLIVWWTGLYIDTLYKNYSVPEVEPDFALREKREKDEQTEPGILRKRLMQIDPDEAKKHHPHSTRYIIRALEIYEKTGQTKSEAAKEQPVQWPMLMIGLWRSREDSNERIAKRVVEMVENGLIDEVKWLLAAWYSPDLQSMQGIGYKETVEYLAWHISLKKLTELITIHTQQYAKRQRTWFRRYINDSEKNPKDNVVYKMYEME